MFDDIEIGKITFNDFRYCIDINNVDIDKIIIFNQILFSEKRFDETIYTFLSNKFLSEIEPQKRKNLKKVLQRSPV